MTAPTDESPWDRLERAGPEALTDVELLALLLRSGRRGTSVLSVAQSVLDGLGGLSRLASASDHLLRQLGVGPVKAATIVAAVELGRRLARVEIKARRLLDCPAAVARYLALRYGNGGQEVMGALYLNGSQRLIVERVHFRGTMTRAAVEPRQIFEAALQCRAVSFVLFHTHPSGDPAPSSEDLAFTRRMVDAADVLCISMADHLIIGTGDQWTSLRRLGAW